MVTAHDDITDLVKGTLRHLGRMKFQQIAQNLQRYEVLGRWLKKDKVVFDSGRGIQRNLMSRLSNTAAHVGLLETDGSVLPDLMEQLNIPWRHAQVNWSFLYQTDILMNRGPSLVYNVVKPRRAAALINMAEELEAKAWSVPDVDNKTDPYGLPYWVVGNDTTGFNGGLPGSHTKIAGLDLTTDAPNFKNYTAQYTNVDKPDLIKKMRTAHRKIGFYSPIEDDDYAKAAFRDMRVYTDDTTVSELEDIGESQNENLGRDLASMEAGVPKGGGKDIRVSDSGVIMFKRHPIIWVPQLDDTTVFTAETNPVYMINHDTFYPMCLKGDFLREGSPREVPDQHNAWRVFVDLSYNYLCVDRRRNAVFRK
jgi:hypothetical protein